MRRHTILLALLAASAARAGENDLQLWRLGHPDCLRCNGTPGEVNDSDPLAQARFHRLASTLGLAFAPPFQETAGTLGQSGFEVGVSSSEAFLRISGDAWPTRVAAPPKVLTLPTVTLRKGLGASLELGAAVSWLADSQMMALSAELRWALLDGFATAPDLALRVWGTRALGTQELALAAVGVDAQLSKSFGAFGSVKLQPYLQGGVEMVNALSSEVTFKPSAKNPQAAVGIFHSISLLDNRYLRAALGLRMVVGVVVLGVEGTLAQGTNAIESNAPPAAQKNFIRLWSGAARLGFSF